MPGTSSRNSSFLPSVELHLLSSERDAGGEKKSHFQGLSFAFVWKERQQTDMQLIKVRGNRIARRFIYIICMDNGSVSCLMATLKELLSHMLEFRAPQGWGRREVCYGGDLGPCFPLSFGFVLTIAELGERRGEQKVNMVVMNKKLICKDLWVYLG